MNKEKLKDELMKAMENDRIEQEKESTEKGKNTPWYLKLAALARILIVSLEAGKDNLKGEEKASIIVNSLSKAWDGFCPTSIKVADRLTCGLIKKLVLNVINDVIVLVYNKILGHDWFRNNDEIIDNGEK